MLTILTALLPLVKYPANLHLHHHIIKMAFLSESVFLEDFFFIAWHAFGSFRPEKRQYSSSCF